MFSFDLVILHAVQSIASPWLTWLMRLVTNIFLPEVILPAVGAVLLFLFIKHKRLQEVFLMLILLGNVLTLVLKPIIHQPRPTSAQAVIYDRQSNYSLPSGHAVAAMTVGGAVVLLFHRRRRPSAMLIAVVAILILLIGFSRVYLGAHWPSDVLVGYGLGWLWLMFIWRVVRPPLERRWSLSNNPKSPSSGG